MTKPYTWEERVPCNDRGVMVFPKQLLLRDWLGNQSAGGIDCFFITSFFFFFFLLFPSPPSQLLMCLYLIPQVFFSILPLQFCPPTHCWGVNEAGWELNSQLGSSHHKPSAQSKSCSPGCFWDLTEPNLEDLSLTLELVLLWAGGRSHDLMRSIPVWLVLWSHVLQLL